MATGTIQNHMPKQAYLGRITNGTTTTTTDLSPYLTHFGDVVGGNDASYSCAILIVLKSWTTGTNYASVYMLSSIQNSAYVELVELGKNANGPTATIASGTLTVTWPTTGGGTITLLKIA